MESPTDAYTRWTDDPSQQNMASIVQSLGPTINSEIQRYPGPKPLLRTQGKKLAIKAVKSYDPGSGAKLNSWVVTQMQPLTRYGREVGSPLRASELAIRQAAEVEATRKRLLDDLGDEPTHQQLADEIGISQKRVRHLQSTVRAVSYEGTLEDAAEDSGPAPAVKEMGTDPNLATAVEMVYEGLGKRDQMIFDYKTGKNGRQILDNKSIALRLGVSPALVSQRSSQITSQILQTRDYV